MDSFLTLQEREYYKQFIKAHPIPDDFDPDIFDDNRFSEIQNISTAYLMKMMLEECEEDEGKQEK